MNKLFFKYILGFVAVIILFISCDDDDKSQQSNLFRPTVVTTEIEEGSVLFKWTAFNTSFQGEVKEYEISISETEDFNEVVLSDFTKDVSYLLTSGPVITNTEIYDYYVRVKAISAVSGTADSEYTKPVLFSPYRENIFSTVRQEDLSNTFVILRWRINDDGSAPDVTKIVLENEDGEKIGEYSITDDEKDTRKKQIDGLNPLSTYTAYIYNEGVRRGRITFTTRPENEIIIGTSDDLEQAIKDIQPGWIIRLQPGFYDYSSKSITINKSITFESYSSENLATVSLSKFALRENIGKFAMVNVIFDGQGSSSDFIEFSKSDDANGIGEFNSIDTLMIEGCQVSNFSKSLMIYSATATDQMSIKNILINNSIINDINTTGTAGAQTIDLRNYTTDNIKITNSTFYNMGRTLIRMKDAANNQNFELSNCTFYNFAPQGQYFIDFGNSALNGGNYIIKNNIFSKLFKTGKGYRIGNADSSINAEYSYNNEHDIVWSGNTAPSSGWTENKNILNLDPQFNNPDGGEFKLGNSTLKKAASNGGALGDPRWGK